MTDRIQTDSGYGLFGEARYQSDEAAWKAQRRLDAPSASVALVPDEHNPEEDDASTLTDVLTEPGRSAAVEEIIGCEPTLQPARGLIANLLAESPPHDDLDNDGVGELMAVVFTSAKERRHRRVKPEDAGDPFFRKQPILVVSKERNILEFIAPTKSSIAFQQDGEASSEGYELSGAERLQYVTEDGPIQQVTRPELFTNLDAPSIVGVRTASAILIFQPVFRKVKLPAGTHRGPKVTAEASLQPNLINRINLDPRLGACRGHIALNPWDDGQLAYVADDGSWTVWSLRNKGGTPISQSRLNPHTNNRISSDNRSGYRIIWILDAYHVLVSSTDAVQVFDLMGRLVGRWSLDVRAFGSFMISTKPSSWDPATIMLFTTSHVLLLSVTIGKALSIECAMAWRHNLSSSQALYGIHCLSSYNAENQCLLLASSRTSLLLQLSLPNRTNRKTTLCDATRAQRPSKPICGLATLPVRMPEKDRSWPDKEAHSEEHEILIAQVFALGRDMELGHALCYMPALPLSRSAGWSHRPQWSFMSRSHLPKSAQYVHESDDEDFVVRDLDPWSGVSQDSESSAMRRSSITASRSQLEAAFSIPHDRAYRSIALSGAVLDTELTDALMDLRGSLSSITPEHRHLATLDERLPQSLRLADIEQASASVSELLYRPYPEEVAGSDSPSLATLSPIGTLSLATVGVEDLSLNTIYGRLMSCWLRPFTHRAPPRNRISLEHLIRRIAAAVLLSGITVENVGADIQAPENGGAREGLPSRTPPSQVPTPTPTPATDDNLPLLTLRRHTNFEASAQTLSGPVTKILDHWDPAIDPSDYDYARKTAQTGEEDAGQMSQEDKQREQRRAESKRRREESSQRKRAIKEPATSGAQSQPQAAMPPWSSPPSASTQTAGMSQPLAGPFVQASQPILSSQAPTTAGQVQPGKFGGKLPFRGRRKAGF